MIRKMLFILLAAAGLLGPATELSAQRCLYGQTGIQFNGGPCGGFLLRDKYGAWSFHADLSVIRYVRKNRYWEFCIGYLRKDYDGAALKNRNNFIYGGEITLSGEAYLCDRAVLLLMLKERIMGGSSVSCFHTLLGAGLRIMIY